MELNEKQIQNYWKKVDVKGEDDCWEWTGCTFNQGYGRVRIDCKIYTAHRISWMITNGDIPKDKDILHSCDNPGCCNPNHLRAGTHKENMKDKIYRNRCNPPKGEKQWCSKLSEKQIMEIRNIYKDNDKLNKTELGRQYGVSRQNIIEIIKHTTWKHI